MKAGKLIHVITLQRAATTIGPTGTPASVWSQLVVLRAERVEQTTEEFMRGSGANDETAIVFRTRFFAGVTNADRVSFGGQVFNLKEVMVLGRNRGLELRCTRID